METALQRIEEALLTCTVCGARIIRLSDYWGCMKGPSHSKLRSDKYLRDQIAALIDDDGTKDRTRFNAALNETEVLKEGRDVQLDKLLTALHLRCGFKVPRLATKPIYKAYQAFCRRHPDQLCAFGYQDWWLAFGDAAQTLRSRYRWTLKDCSFVWRNQKGDIVEEVETVLAHSHFDLEGKIEEQLRREGVTLG